MHSFILMRLTFGFGRILILSVTTTKSHAELTNSNDIQVVNNLRRIRYNPWGNFK